MLTPIKTENATEPNSQLYRFSPSPPLRYHHQPFSAEVRGPTSASSFENEHPSFPNGSSGSYHSSSSGVGGSYTASGSTHGGTYSDGGSGDYPLSGSEDSRNYGEHYHGGGSSSQNSSFCSCRTTAAATHEYLKLSHHLDNTLGSLRQYAPHPTTTQCTLYRRIVELNSMLQ